MVHLFAVVLLFNLSCKDDPPVVPPPPPEPEAALSLENISCTEAWLKLELKNFTLPVNVKLL